MDSLSDEGLRSLIERARRLLATRADERRKQDLAREKERRKQALAQIRRLAKEHGLDVAVKKPGRKRGRPPKAGPAAT